ncbi:MAG TPA: BsuBI/PstI family type II restriction endonuclease [Blastocatellia bacterium]
MPPERGAKAKKIQEALLILEGAGVPVNKLSTRRKERAALALLAVANIKPRTSAEYWQGPDSWMLTSREVISFLNKHYGQKIKDSSYDDIRRLDLLYAIEAGLVTASAANPDANPNSPTRRYAIRQEAAELLRTFGTSAWEGAVADYAARFGSLKERLERRREYAKVPVRLPNGDEIKLSPGVHNELQKAVVEEFLPRYAPGAEVLYLGDATKKALVIERPKLEELGFFTLAHGALPDVVAYSSDRNWLLLIEAVHSSNPISHLRHLMLERLTAACPAPRIYVSVFKDRRALRQWLPEISWETEVWLADSPDHLIHFDGTKFLGPYLDTKK